MEDRINQYINDQSETKRRDLRELHQRICSLMTEARLWFLDGKNSDGKVVSNPNIGYGCYTIRYADGSSREFYQIGLSANSSGISLYIMGLPSKTYLPETYGALIGKASVTGYCIRFKALKEVHLNVLEAAIRDGVGQSSAI